MRAIRWVCMVLVCALLLGACGQLPTAVPAGASAGKSEAGSASAPTAPTTGAATANRVLLGVAQLLQEPELPNGCEATSLAMLLRYWGYDADKMDVAYHQVPREDFTFDYNAGWWMGPDPAVAYAGDPADIGFYCFAPVVAEGANRYLAAAGGAHLARDITGAPLEDLFGWLRQGVPVAVWVTKDFGEPAYDGGFAWLLDTTAEAYYPYSNLHCAVLVGYDAAGLLLRDPLVQGYHRVDRDTFQQGYEALGSQAVVLIDAQKA